MTSKADYWKIIDELLAAHSKQAHARVTKKSGISSMPFAVASKAFIHPSYNLLDPFHLFFENIVALLWDIWSVDSRPGFSPYIFWKSSIGNLVSLLRRQVLHYHLHSVVWSVILISREIANTKSMSGWPFFTGISCQ